MVCRTKRCFPGSSPHQQGARHQRTAMQRPVWIIPAPAGNTGRQLRTTRRAPDHPRAREQHFIADETGGGRYGSPPHQRGARQVTTPQRSRDRIIPAPAGSTTNRRGRRGRVADHPARAGTTTDSQPAATTPTDPRMRGDDMFGVTVDTITVGPPPHARGRRCPDRDPHMDRGTTPACAGTTESAPVGRRR